jgi:DnaK suppressor protein
VRAKDDWDLADERGEPAPRRDGLDEPSVAAIRRRLEAQLDTLVGERGALEKPPEAGATPQYGKRIGDHTSDAVESRRNVAAADTLRLQEAEVRRALAKLDEGTHGTCDGCAGPIGAARLEALPWAVECIACRARRTTRVTRTRP